MGWSGTAPNKTYSRTDGTRTGSTVWEQAEGAGVDIVSDDHDTHDQDIATSLNTSLQTDGKNKMTAGLPAADGSESLPGYGFASDPDTGFYRFGSGTIGYSSNGTKSIEFGSASATVSGAAPSLALDKSSGAAVIAGRTSGSQRWQIDLGDGSTESGSNAGSDFYIRNYNDAGSQLSLAVKITRATGYFGVPGVYSQTTASATNVHVDSSGNIMRSTSSERYKTGVEDLDAEHRDKIMEMRPVYYRSTCAADNPEWSFYGLLAEEVATIDPRLVFWRTTETDSDGVVTQLATPIAEGVQYERIVPHLIAKIQELAQRVAALEAA